MKTFATIGMQNTFRPVHSGALVGRMVANTSLIEALIRHGSFDRFLFFVGDPTEIRPLRELFVERFGLAPERFATAPFHEIPRRMREGDLQVFHHGEPCGRGLDIAHLRRSHAVAPLPVTGQIHSLSYPRSVHDYLRMTLLPLGREDAIFCSTEAGKRVFEGCLDRLSESLVEAGQRPLSRDFLCPVVPLGVDAEGLSRGDGARMRKTLGLSESALVLLVIGRFTLHDKMDLVPLLQVFARVRAQLLGMGEEVHLVLAGAEQGTGALAMIDAWIRMLRLEGSITLHPDFPEDEKSDLLAAADVFLSPVDNPQETFGLSVVEALAAGLPVICSDFNGYKETVPEAVGIRVPTTWGGDFAGWQELGTLAHEAPLHYQLGQSVTVDLEALEEAILRVLTDAGLRLRMSTAARLRGLETYDWKVLVPQYEAVWDELRTRARFAGAKVTKHPLGMDYSRIFAHYPTTFATDDDELCTSDFGRELLLSGLMLPMPPQLAWHFTAALAARLLERAIAPLSVRALIAETAGEDLDQQKSARLCIAWLRKHGALARREAAGYRAPLALSEAAIMGARA